MRSLLAILISFVVILSFILWGKIEKGLLFLLIFMHLPSILFVIIGSMNSLLISHSFAEISKCAQVIWHVTNDNINMDANILREASMVLGLFTSYSIIWALIGMLVNAIFVLFPDGWINIRFGIIFCLLPVFWGLIFFNLGFSLENKIKHLLRTISTKEQ